MKKIIKKSTILCIALGIIFNLVPLNIHTSDISKKNQEFKYLANDELIYPQPKSVQASA